MITSEILNSPDIVYIDLKGKLSRLYIESGIPKKYHFCNMETDWSQAYSPNGQLSGIAKKRSEIACRFFKSYIEALGNIFSGQGLKVKLKNSIQIITDVILDGTRSSGKTFLMSVVGQQAINNGYSCKFVEWPEFLDRFHSFDLRNENESFFRECLEVDLLIFDSIKDYDINNSKFFNVQLDRLISSRLNSGKVTICSIDTVDNQNPTFGPIWNKFSRETFTFKLPEASINNETKPKRTRT